MPEKFLRNPGPVEIEWEAATVQVMDRPSTQRQTEHWHNGTMGLLLHFLIAGDFFPKFLLRTVLAQNYMLLSPFDPDYLPFYWKTILCYQIKSYDIIDTAAGQVNRNRRCDVTIINNMSAHCEAGNSNCFIRKPFQNLLCNWFFVKSRIALSFKKILAFMEIWKEA